MYSRYTPPLAQPGWRWRCRLAPSSAATAASAQPLPSPAYPLRPSRSRSGSPCTCGAAARARRCCYHRSPLSPACTVGAHPPVLADAAARCRRALLAHAAHPPVLTDAGAAAVLAQAAHPPVLADAATAAVLATVAPPPVLLADSQRPLRGRCRRSPCRTCVPARARTCHSLPSSLPAPLSSSLSPPLQPPSPPPSPPPLPPRPPPSPPPLSPPPPLSTPVSPPASGTPHRGLSRKMSPMRPARPRFRRELPAGSSLLHALSGCGISLRKGSQCFGLFLFKASMVGSTLLSRSYYYMRRRSPGPPFPPDHRLAGERGAIIRYGTQGQLCSLLPSVSMARG